MIMKECCASGNKCGGLQDEVGVDQVLIEPVQIGAVTRAMPLSTAISVGNKFQSSESLGRTCWASHTIVALSGKDALNLI